MSKTTTVHLFDRTIDRVRDLKQHYGMGFSALVRVLIDQAWERLKK